MTMVDSAPGWGGRGLPSRGVSGSRLPAGRASGASVVPQWCGRCVGAMGAAVPCVAVAAVKGVAGSICLPVLSGALPSTSAADVAACRLPERCQSVGVGPGWGGRYRNQWRVRSLSPPTLDG